MKPTPQASCSLDGSYKPWAIIGLSTAFNKVKEHHIATPQTIQLEQLGSESIKARFILAKF
jgi:hypothetical protein